MRNEFYKDAQGCLLVYDVTNRASFEALQSWLQEAKDNGAEHMVGGGAWRGVWEGVKACQRRAKRGGSEEGDVV